MALTFEEQQMAKVAGEGIKAASGELGAKPEGHIHIDVDVFLSPLDRARVLFGAALKVHVHVTTDRDPGRARSDSDVSVGRSAPADGPTLSTEEGRLAIERADITLRHGKP